MITLEFLGAIYSILGAWHMSGATKEKLNRAFFSFLISNSALLLFFILNGKMPMVVQFIFFYMTAILGLYRTTEDVKRTHLFVFISILTLIIAVGISFPMIKEVNMTILPLDTFASSLAVIGAYMLSSKSYMQRNIAYFMFVIADIIFVYIGYVNGFWFFLLQSAWFIFTGTKGLVTNIKLNR